MEIFITLTKYNTHQRFEEGKPLLVVYYLISILRYFSYVPPTGLLWLDQAQGRSLKIPRVPSALP